MLTPHPCIFFWDKHRTCRTAPDKAVTRRQVPRSIMPGRCGRTSEMVSVSMSELWLSIENGVISDIPFGYVKIAIEHGDLYWIYWIYPLKMVIFHSYVSLPEGNGIIFCYR